MDPAGVSDIDAGPLWPEVRVELARLDAAPSEVDRLSALLDAGERGRAAAFAGAADSRRFIVRRGRLRQWLARELSCAPEAIEFGANPYGKPQIVGHDLRFSVSHSADFALFVASKGREVGCDLEVRRPKLASWGLARRYFSKSEQRQLAGVAPDRWAEAFFNCWTRKEALVKGLGIGLSYPLESFDVSVSTDVPNVLLSGPIGWRIFARATPPNLHIAVAVGPEPGRPPRSAWAQMATRAGASGNPGVSTRVR